MEELGVYFVSFDRAGYGESDPNPGRTVRSEAMDIQELADKLGLGDRFYVIGASMGGYPAWSCVKHIPHRQSSFPHRGVYQMLFLGYSGWSSATIGPLA